MLDGSTTAEPFSGIPESSSITAGEIETVFAFLVDQIRVAADPCATDDGCVDSSNVGEACPI